MDAKEYLEKRCPDSTRMIKKYVPAKINLESMLEEYYQQRSKEEAEERFGQAMARAIRRTGESDGGITQEIITEVAKIAAFGKDEG